MWTKVGIVAVIIGVILGALKSYEALATEIGQLRSDNAALSGKLEDAEEDKRQADDRIRHLSQIFMDLTESREQARKQIDAWRRKFEEDKNNDKNCKDWSDTPLPACVINRLRWGNSDPANSDNGGPGGGGAGSPDGANPSP